MLHCIECKFDYTIPSLHAAEHLIGPERIADLEAVDHHIPGLSIPARRPHPLSRSSYRFQPRWR
jgi:hypothetical protein